jgi:hypothetical protein
MPSSSSVPPSPFYDPSRELASHVEAYHRTGDVGTLLDQLKALAARTAPDLLKSAAQDYKEMPEVVIPLYERVVALCPDDAQAMVVLANSYWLVGRGPQIVGQLATRAKEIDPSNRGAWHLWALADPTVRGRVDRWMEVARRFPQDQLARAALADNAVSLYSEQDDPAALELAITTYKGLLAESKHTAQRLAIEETLKKLGGNVR